METQLVLRLSRQIRTLLAAGLKTGSYTFQDAGSQMVARSLSVEKDDAVLDLCAAPGSKTTLIRAELTKAGGGRLVATDTSPKRLEVLKENLERQRSGAVEVVLSNADEPLPFGDAEFDKVLVDTPCSGTGTIRHNPELRYLVSEGSISASADKQLALLRRASNVVKSGGTLTYSTCSLERDENEEIVSAFLEERNDFEIAVPGVDRQYVEESGFARTFPDRDGIDGFFIASLKKR